MLPSTANPGGHLPKDRVGADVPLLGLLLPEGRMPLGLEPLELSGIRGSKSQLQEETRLGKKEVRVLEPKTEPRETGSYSS